MERKTIHDFNKYRLSDRNGTYGGMAGSKEGIFIDGDYWLIKYPKSTRGMDIDGLSYTTSPLSEYIGSHVYDLLGYEVHETLLGERGGKIVVACKDFCKELGALREIRTLKNTYHADLERILDTQLHTTGSNHIVELKEILIHLEYNPILSQIEGLGDRFWDCAVIDGLINNNDRNNGNWGLLFESGRYKIAPIFDNGAAFSDKLSEDKISRLLISEERIRSSVLNTVTIYGIDDKRLSFKELLSLDDSGLKAAVRRNVPLIKKAMPELISFISDIPNEYEGITVCSEERKKFYIEGMKLRLEYLLEPALESMLSEKKPSLAEQMDAASGLTGSGLKAPFLNVNTRVGAKER